MIFSELVQLALNMWRNSIMKLSDLNFTVELKSTYAMRPRFPSDDVVGVSMSRPDKKKDNYRLKILIPEAACKKALIKPLGFVMANISECSNGLQILYEEEQGSNFKGYAVRTLGAYLNQEGIKAKQKENKHPYMPLFAELTIPFSLLDMKRSQPFSNKFSKIIAIGKHNMVVDISNNVPVFVPKGKGA